MDSSAPFVAPRLGLLFALGLALFLQYAFDTRDFHKLYADVPEWNYPQFGRSAMRLFGEERRTPDHFYFRGRYWAEIRIALYQETWRTKGKRLYEAAL